MEIRVSPIAVRCAETKFLQIDRQQKTDGIILKRLLTPQRSQLVHQLLKRIGFLDSVTVLSCLTANALFR